MIYILDCIPHFSIHMDAIILCCTVMMGYLGADVFGRCTDSNRLQANDWANTASQLILAHRRRNFVQLQKDSEQRAQPNFNLCAAADLAGWAAAAAEGSLCWYRPLDQSSRENRFPDETADHGRYFPGDGWCGAGGRRWYRLRSQMSLSQPG